MFNKSINRKGCIFQVTLGITSFQHWALLQRWWPQCLSACSISRRLIRRNGSGEGEPGRAGQPVGGEQPEPNGVPLGEAEGAARVAEGAGRQVSPEYTMPPEPCSIKQVVYIRPIWGRTIWPQLQNLYVKFWVEVIIYDLFEVILCDLIYGTGLR